MAILNGGINMKRLGKYTGNIYDENFDTSKINECCLLIKDEDAENKEYIDNKRKELKQKCLLCMGCPAAMTDK